MISLLIHKRNCLTNKVHFTNIGRERRLYVGTTILHDFLSILNNLINRYIFVEELIQVFMTNFCYEKSEIES